MTDLQPTSYKLQAQRGFTLIELMVVIVIMALLASVLVLNLAGQRAKRDVQIAENELVSNIRQIQSGTLSAKALPAAQSVQYYMLKFDLAKPGQYTIQAVYNVDTAPKLADIQTIYLPPDVVIASATPGGAAISISRQQNPVTQILPSTDGSCALLAYSAPFAKVLMSNTCVIANPPLISKGDDYYSMVNFQTNQLCLASDDPSGCNLSADSTMTITLTNTDHTYFKTVTVSGITGAVNFN
ncbi:MAG: type II secretion system protein [Candidatus Doudnabacteria bacterium]|nr:type II secretion system protein [Candidatus Doudnabacteria bacterium]